MADSTLLAAAAACISPLLAAGGLYLTWRKARQDRLQREEDALRRGDVLIWANESIRQLQSLVLVCKLREEELDEVSTKEKLTDIIFNTSILVERGRLFFKNVVADDYGDNKEAAYRGYRPMVLDQLVAAHLIACGWMTAS